MSRSAKPSANMAAAQAASVRRDKFRNAATSA